MRALVTDPADNVAVITENGKAGTTVSLTDGRMLTLAGDIPVGHKAALEDIPCGSPVIKYGVPIGEASRDIRKGEHVHTDNVKDITEELCRQYAAAYREGGREE